MKLLIVSNISKTVTQSVYSFGENFVGIFLSVRVETKLQINKIYKPYSFSKRILSLTSLNISYSQTKMVKTHHFFRKQ